MFFLLEPYHHHQEQYHRHQEQDNRPEEWQHQIIHLTHFLLEEDKILSDL
tara:strand:+ start:193 stop:342 length:150 start_codon:yes stop_codon:yes gene_type:complete